MKKISAIFYSLLLIFSLLSVTVSANDLTAGDPKIAGTLIFTQMKPGVQFEGKVELELYQNEKLFAQTEIQRPRFPQAYLVGPKNALTPGIPFQGEFKLVAKLVRENGSKVAEVENGKVLAGTRAIVLEFTEK